MIPLKKRQCPNCGSTNVEPKTEEVVGYRKNPDVWKCKNCSYSGFMPVENPNTEFEEKEESEVAIRKPDSSAIIGILLVLTSILLLTYHFLI